MTLVLIVIAALSQAGLARKSLQLATESTEAQRQLQRRWGGASVRDLLLEHADELFSELENAHLESDLPWPSSSKLNGRVTLGGMEFRIWLADEQAKLNLNTLQHRHPEFFRETFNFVAGNRVPPKLRPDRRTEAAERKQWYQSWGQVYELSPLLSQGNLESLLLATEEITCWGNGRINLWRASDALLETIVTRVLDGETARKLIAARQEAATEATPLMNWEDLLRKSALRRRQQSKLRSWLTDQSRCYSLWVAIDDGRRTWYHLWIKGDRAATGESPYIAFHW